MKGRRVYSVVSGVLTRRFVEINFNLILSKGLSSG
jgi:hypothetical protein